MRGECADNTRKVRVALTRILRAFSAYSPRILRAFSARAENARKIRGECAWVRVISPRPGAWYAIACILQKEIFHFQFLSQIIINDLWDQDADLQQEMLLCQMFNIGRDKLILMCSSFFFWLNVQITYLWKSPLVILDFPHFLHYHSLFSSSMVLALNLQVRLSVSNHICKIKFTDTKVFNIFPEA